MDDGMWEWSWERELPKRDGEPDRMGTQGQESRDADRGDRGARGRDPGSGGMRSSAESRERGWEPSTEVAAGTGVPWRRTGNRDSGIDEVGCRVKWGRGTLERGDPVGTIGEAGVVRDA